MINLDCQEHIQFDKLVTQTFIAVYMTFADKSASGRQTVIPDIGEEVL